MRHHRPLLLAAFHRLLEQIGAYDGLVVRSGVQVTEDVSWCQPPAQPAAETHAGCRADHQGWLEAEDSETGRVAFIVVFYATPFSVLSADRSGRRRCRQHRLGGGYAPGRNCYEHPRREHVRGRGADDVAAHEPRAGDPRGGAVDEGTCSSAAGVAATRHFTPVTTAQDGHWDRKRFAHGVELRGKTIGVVGLGMIGSEVARRCLALDMKVLSTQALKEPQPPPMPLINAPPAQVVGFDPQVTEEAAALAGVRKVSLDELWAAADFVTLHTPLNAATRHLVNAQTLARCRRGVFIINAARGGIVDEAALLSALESGHVAGAALDVYEVEPPPPAARALLTHPHVLCTPHLGASTEEAQRKVAREVAQQMCDAFRGRGFVGVVNAAHLGLLAARPALAPYVRLAEALGSLQAQVRWTTQGEVRQREVGEAAGSLTQTSPSPATPLSADCRRDVPVARRGRLRRARVRVDRDRRPHL